MLTKVVEQLVKQKAETTTTDEPEHVKQGWRGRAALVVMMEVVLVMTARETAHALNTKSDLLFPW